MQDGVARQRPVSASVAHADATANAGPSRLLEAHVARNGGLVQVHTPAVRYCTAVVAAVAIKARNPTLAAAAPTWATGGRS